MNFSRRFYYILGAVVAVPVVLFAAAALIIYTQSDTIKARLLEEVNKSTGAHASISGKVELSFFRHFPNVALELKGVTVQGSVDTLQYPLLKAERIYFLANFWDVVQGTWNIKSTSVENGEFSMLRMKNGVVNYLFKTEEKDSTKPAAPFSIDVEKALLKNVRYRLLDEIAEVEIDIQVDDATVNGNFTAENLSLHAAADVFSHAVTIKGIDYADEKGISFDGSLAVMTEENSYALHIDKFFVEKNEFSVNGSITMVDDNPVFDLAIRGKDIAVKDIPFLLPAEYTAKLNGIKGSGNLQLSAEIKGVLDKKRNPEVTINGNAANASLQIPGMDGKINGLAFTGTFTNGSKQRLSTSVLTVKDLTAKVKQGALDGSFVLTNFDKPSLKLNVDGVLDLSIVNKFLDDSGSLKRLGGTVNFNDVKYNGKIADLQAMRLVGMEGAIAAKGVEIVLAKQKIQVPEAKLAAYNKTLTIEKLDVKLPASQFSVSGKIDQVPGLAGNKKGSAPPHAELTVRSESLNILELFALMNGDEKAKPNTKQQPMDFSGNISLQANNVVYDKFQMYDVAGQVTMSGSVIKLQDFSCNAADGVLDFNSTISLQGDQVATKTHAKGESVNLKEIFAQFENFDQTTVTDEHISGTMAFTADVTANFMKGVLDEKTIAAVVDLTVKHGELVGMKSLENLSRFIDVADLRHLRFSTLKNKITISNETVHIPDMLVESNAINIALSGSQTFKGAINYSVRLNLFDVLGKKIRKRKDLTEYEQAGEDNFNFYLSLTGTTDNPTVKYDKRSIKERLAQQKEDFRKASALEPQYVDEDEEKVSAPGKGFKEKTIFTNKRQKEVKQEEDEPEFIEWDEEN